MLWSFPDAATKHCRKGLRLLGRDRYDAATIQLAKAVALDPPWGDAHVLLGYALRMRGQTEEAVKAFRAGLQRGVSADMLKNGALHMFVSDLLKCGCPAEALDIVERWEDAGLETIPPETAGLKGRCLWELERYHEALLAFRKAIGDDPGELLWFLGAAMMAAECGNVAALKELHEELREMLSRASSRPEAEDIREALTNVEELLKETKPSPAPPNDLPRTQQMDGTE